VLAAVIVAEIEPALVAPGEVSVVFYPDEAWVHGRHLAGRLVDRAVELGAGRRFSIAVSDIDVGADGSIRAVACPMGALSTSTSS
jgi:glycine/D-amino acid oxidase-like deaminating enzyme